MKRPSILRLELTLSYHLKFYSLIFACILYTYSPIIHFELFQVFLDTVVQGRCSSKTQYNLASCDTSSRNVRDCTVFHFHHAL